MTDFESVDELSLQLSTPAYYSLADDINNSIHHDDDDMVKVPISYQIDINVATIEQRDEVEKLNYSSDRFGTPVYPNKDDLQMLDYPRSAALFHAMGQQFGYHNVAPLPSWLAEENDRSRAQWYKSGPNALLYFLYRKPKYMKAIQKLNDSWCLLNWGCCYHCKTGNIYDYAEGQYCCMFCPLLYIIYPFCGLCVFYPCLCRVAAYQLHQVTGVEPKDVPSKWCNDDFGVASRLETTLERNLADSGIQNVSRKSTCRNCISYMWCFPWVHSKNQAIIDYYLHKRYGFWLDPHDRLKSQKKLFSKIYGSTTMPSGWEKVNKAIDKKPNRDRFSSYRSSSSPKNQFSRENIDNSYQDRGYWSTNGEGENVYHDTSTYYPVPSHPLFIEWYDQDRAVQEHNTKWAGTHKLLLPSVQTNNNHGQGKKSRFDYNNDGDDDE